MKQILFLFLALFLASCEKPLFNEETKEEKGNLTLSFYPSYPGMVTRGTSVSLRDVSSRLNVMLFNEDGTKAFDKVKTQTSDDEEYGTLNLSVKAGTYYIVAIAHSGAKAATISSTEKVSFTLTNGVKVTDTFYYYGTVEVTEENKSFDYPVVRGVGCFRLQLTDESHPDMVTRIKFHYTGGSADINPSTGIGCTKSTQTEYRTINSNHIYDAFTFPRADSPGLKMTISALDAEDNVIASKVIENVPIAKNTMSFYKGTLYSGDENSIQPASIGFTADPEWNDTIYYTF